MAWDKLRSSVQAQSAVKALSKRVNDAKVHHKKRGKKALTHREIKQLRQRMEQEQVALDRLCQAKEELAMVDWSGEDMDTNVEHCDTAIDHLIVSIRYNESLDAAYFWRAEAFRIRALCRQNPKGKEWSRTETRRTTKLQLEDRRCALADVDHMLRFFDPKETEGCAQTAVAWQLRGRIRAALGYDAWVQDFEMARKLDPGCAVTYLTWARLLWRNKRFDEAEQKYQDGMKFVHSDGVREEFKGELLKLQQQKEDYLAWMAREAERLCVVM